MRPRPRASAPERSTPSITPNAAVATAINFAQAQLGKPYLFGGTGPDAFDCSGLVMMAYRAAGINIPRTSEDQWAQLPHVPAGNVEPGDLVFFAGADGTPTSPGHVGLVIGHDKMIEAYATGFPIRISTFGSPTSQPGLSQVVGFARPWAQPGLNLGNSVPRVGPGRLLPVRTLQSAEQFTTLTGKTVFTVWVPLARGRAFRMAQAGPGR